MPPRKVWEGNADLARLTVPVAKLQPHPSNPRKGDVVELMESLRRFGQQRPILALPDGTIVAGHHVFYAARDLGWTHVAVIRSDLTDSEVEAYLLADNRLGQLGTYDQDALAALLLPFHEAGQLAGTGFSQADTRALLAAARARSTDGDADVAPPVPETPKSEPGVVYELGPHRLLCGDAADPDAYRTVLNGQLADMVWTDPPYGVDVVGGSRALPVQRRKAEGHRQIMNDALSPAAFRTFLADTLSTAKSVCRAGANWYVASPTSDLADVFTDVLGELGLRRWTLVWVKNSMVLSRMDYHPRHELIHYGWLPGAGRVRPSDRTLTTVLEVDRPARSAEHPTMKPVELVEICVAASSRPGETVLDPFGGSGTTLIAAERLGREARLIELDPGYCDVIRQRYADYVGDQGLAP